MQNNRFDSVHYTVHSRFGVLCIETDREEYSSPLQLQVQKTLPLHFTYLGKAEIAIFFFFVSLILMKTWWYSLIVVDPNWITWCYRQKQTSLHACMYVWIIAMMLMQVWYVQTNRSLSLHCQPTKIIFVGCGYCLFHYHTCIHIMWGLKDTSCMFYLIACNNNIITVP